MKRKVFSIVMVLFFMIGCAGTSKLFVHDATQTTGYVIAKKNPQLGNELLKYTKVFLTQPGQELVNFQSWKKFFIKSVVEDAFLRMKAERFLSLVEIDLKLKNSIEKQEIIMDVFTEFVSGLEIGINAFN